MQNCPDPLYLEISLSLVSTKKSFPGEISRSDKNRTIPIQFILVSFYNKLKASATILWKKIHSMQPIGFYFLLYIKMTFLYTFLTFFFSSSHYALGTITCTKFTEFSENFRMGGGVISDLKNYVANFSIKNGNFLGEKGGGSRQSEWISLQIFGPPKKSAT